MMVVVERDRRPPMPFPKKSPTEDKEKTVCEGHDRCEENERKQEGPKPKAPVDAMRASIDRVSLG
jgi:hypothetical protein